VSRLNNILDVANLSVSFGSATVLANLSFSVETGTSLAVIGPNGSGKTVLFRALIGSIPYEGSIRWAPGTRIGYVPQKLDLERDIPITGLDFLSARAALAGRRGTNVDRAITLVGLSREVTAKSVGTMSGGQFQRLLVAFALVGQPNVLLLDEPTSGVDEPGQERLNELVRRLQQDEGLTVLFISHELSVVFRYANSVLCLGREGAYIGPPKTILTPERLHEVYGTEAGYHVHEQ
jgi:zinc transport system ATP-binding protein